MVSDSVDAITAHNEAQESHNINGGGFILNVVWCKEKEDYDC